MRVLDSTTAAAAASASVVAIRESEFLTQCKEENEQKRASALSVVVIGVDSVALSILLGLHAEGLVESGERAVTRKTTLAYMMRKNGKCILGSNPDSSG